MLYRVFDEYISITFRVFNDFLRLQLIIRFI